MSIARLTRRAHGAVQSPCAMPAPFLFLRILPTYNTAERPNISLRHIPWLLPNPSPLAPEISTHEAGEGKEQCS